MADVNNTTNATATDATTEAQGTETVAETTEENSVPTVEQLMKELAQAKADFAKQKATLDKTLKEKGDLTKSLRAKQTAEEQAAADKQAEDERRQQEYEDALAELNHMKAEQAYSNVQMDSNTIELVIAAVADADHKSIATIIDNEKKAAVKAAQAEWLKSRPQVNAGTGNYSGMTKEQIMAIEDRTQRRKAIAENQELFR